MRILTILTTPYGVNGISTVVKNFYLAIDKKKYHIDFAAVNSPNGNIIDELNANGSNWYVLPRRSRQIIAYIQCLSKILKSNNYDIVHVHGNSRTIAIELFLAKLFKVPIRIAHGHATYTKHPIIHNILSILFFKVVTLGIAVSKDAGNFLFGKYPFEVLENGIEVEKYSFHKENRFKVRNSFSVSDNEILIGNIGRFSQEKNHKFLVKVFKELQKSNNKYKLLLVGDGKLKSSIESQLKDLNLLNKVIFTGNIDNVAEILSAIDIYVVPSVNEGLNITLIEAQASGIPCVASNYIPSEVKLTERFYFLPLSVANFSRTINNINVDVEKRKSLKENIELRKSKFSLKKSVNKLQNIYDSKSRGVYENN